jgi:HAE1 family hydrophobic/amphiphilic exporter-1
MQWLAALCVKRPVFATVLILSLTVIGIFSFTRLGVDRFRRLICRSSSSQPCSPESAEQTRRRSPTRSKRRQHHQWDRRAAPVSSEGVSQVIISFLPSKDINVAAQEMARAR